MMKLVLDFYQASVEALGKGVSVDKLVVLPVRERIGRFKYIPSDQTQQEYDEIIKELNNQIDALAQKEDY